jgi:hypothetical protein
MVDAKACIEMTHFTVFKGSDIVYQCKTIYSTSVSIVLFVISVNKAFGQKREMASFVHVAVGSESIFVTMENIYACKYPLPSLSLSRLQSRYPLVIFLFFELAGRAQHFDRFLSFFHHEGSGVSRSLSCQYRLEAQTATPITI